MEPKTIIEKLREENESLFYLIQELMEYNNQKQAEISGLDYEKPYYFDEQIEELNQLLAFAWVYSMIKEFYDNHIIEKYVPNYEYITEEKHLKTLNKYYYHEIHDLIAIQNLYINELEKIKVKTL